MAGKLKVFRVKCIGNLITPIGGGAFKNAREFDTKMLRLSWPPVWTAWWDIFEPFALEKLPGAMPDAQSVGLRLLWKGRLIQKFAAMNIGRLPRII